MFRRVADRPGSPAEDVEQGLNLGDRVRIAAGHDGEVAGAGGVGPAEDGSREVAQPVLGVLTPSTDRQRGADGGHVHMQCSGRRGGQHPRIEQAIGDGLVVRQHAEDDSGGERLGDAGGDRTGGGQFGDGIR